MRLPYTSNALAAADLDVRQLNCSSSSNSGVHTFLLEGVFPTAAATPAHARTAAAARIQHTVTISAVCRTSGNTPTGNNGTSPSLPPMTSPTGTRRALCAARS